MVNFEANLAWSVFGIFLEETVWFKSEFCRLEEKSMLKVITPFYFPMLLVQRISAMQPRALSVLRCVISVCNQPPKPTQPPTLAGIGRNTSHSVLMLCGWQWRQDGSFTHTTV